MNIPSVRFASRMLGLAGITCLLAATMLSVAAVPVQPASASEVSPPASAVWQPYELNFHYFAANTYYSCSGLENRLEGLLREMGADKDVRASVSGCFGPANLGNMLSARIRLRMPTASGDAVSESFLVSSKTVTLKSGRLGDVGSGDCELLEQVRDQILPALKLQLVKDDLRCVPGAANSPGRSLQVVALLPEVAKR
jgi:hypothetical protein